MNAKPRCGKSADAKVLYMTAEFVRARRHFDQGERFRREFENKSDEERYAILKLLCAILPDDAQQYDADLALIEQFHASCDESE